MDDLQHNTLIMTVTVFDALADALVASYANPPPSSLAQSMTDSAAMVEPLLEASIALAETVTEVLADLDARVKALEAG